MVEKGVAWQISLAKAVANLPFSVLHIPPMPLLHKAIFIVSITWGGLLIVGKKHSFQAPSNIQPWHRFWQQGRGFALIALGLTMLFWTQPLTLIIRSQPAALLIKSDARTAHAYGHIQSFVLDQWVQAMGLKESQVVFHPMDSKMSTTALSRMAEERTKVFIGHSPSDPLFNTSDLKVSERAVAFSLRKGQWVEMPHYPSLRIWDEPPY